MRVAPGWLTGLFLRGRRTLSLVPWAPRGLPPPVGARGKNGVAEEDELDRPILFSSSKANPRRWTVEHSLGSDRRRPWWKVVPLSFSLMVLISWCFLRKETDLDRWLTESLEGVSPEADVDSKQPGSPAGLGIRT
ncbi:ubiquinol-cytochrome-c reductase complex assembly factor 4 [Monodelphis domestica]|uniref:ubiquinol-cytochrome-c reductase complex assembly factor 4 n=1 Tax=Monodelphis domestica TaxID=13616 RepID=UPI0007B40A9D|nr:ubiquinol-cytochrome-c reductase complex assembly factor 4 [Monodelphis domestica]